MSKKVLLVALALDFGATTWYLIFTDRGGDRIERALLGVSFARVADRSVYDIFGPESDIPKFVADRDPKRKTYILREGKSSLPPSIQKA